MFLPTMVNNALMYTEADFVPLSALQHYLYCPRQCALIHLEQIWTENALTAQGRLLHDKAHNGALEKRQGLKTATGLPLRSTALGLAGQSDVVEFHLRNGQWHPYPVEYKRGRPKSMDGDRVQLCAQAMCLEEMLGIAVPEGALFYGTTRRREKVVLDEALRHLTQSTAQEIHALFAGKATPAPPENTKTLCPACSLRETCMPRVPSFSAKGYVDSLLEKT